MKKYEHLVYSAVGLVALLLCWWHSLSRLCYFGARRPHRRQALHPLRRARARSSSDCPPR